MSAIGFAITKITSRFGLLSRKASMRLATETGKKLVDKTNQVGRTLNKSEIEDVFVETLPKRCRPKILTEKAEIKEQFRKLGMTDEMAEIQMENAAAGAVPNGMGKRSIYLPLQEMEEEIPSLTAHEVEHVLESNNTLKGKLSRRVLGLLVLPKLLLDKNFAIKMTNLRQKAGDLEGVLQTRLFSDSEKLYASAPTKEGLAEALSTDAKGLSDKIRQAIREVINPTNSTTSKSEYSVSKQILDIEIPAYKVGGEVERYAMKMGKNETSPSQAVSMVYEEARKILNEEQKLFLKNKKVGKLELPLEYEYDKDFTRLVSNPEEHKLLQEMAKEQELNEAIYNAILKHKPNIKVTKEFIDKTGMELDYTILEVNENILKNSNVVELIKNTNAPNWEKSIIVKNLSYLPEEKIQVIADLIKSLPAEVLAKYDCYYLMKYLGCKPIEEIQKMAKTGAISI